MSFSVRRTFRQEDFCIKSVRHILLPQTDKMEFRSLPNFGWQTEWMMENFMNITYATAECRYCRKILTHTIATLFMIHIRVHKDIYQFEMQHSSNANWKYIKLREDGTMECVVCKVLIDGANLNNEHNHEITYLNARHYQHWLWKYIDGCLLEEKNYVKCDWCDEKRRIFFKEKVLTEHVKDCKETPIKRLFRNYNIFSYLW